MYYNFIAIKETYQKITNCSWLHHCRRDNLEQSHRSETEIYTFQ